MTYTDGAGNTASQSFTWNVADPVTFKDPGDQSVVEGVAVSLAVPATDGIAGAATLSYSAVGLPAGLSISATTGVISGVPAAGDAAAGPYVATVTATDGTYSGSQNVFWNVTAVASSGSSAGAA